NYEEKMTGFGVDETNVYSEQYFSGIRDWAVKSDFDYIPNPDHYIRFGTNVIFHKFSPGVYASKSTEAENDLRLGADELNSVEYALYAEDDINLSSRLKANLGLHYSGFLTGDQHYNSVQPRIAARYLVNSSTSI
ncbi:MAG: TonB-dependent receptor, partial [Cyclobacteriaceae bacterium]